MKKEYCNWRFCPRKFALSYSCEVWFQYW